MFELVPFTQLKKGQMDTFLDAAVTIKVIKSHGLFQDYNRFLNERST